MNPELPPPQAHEREPTQTANSGRPSVSLDLERYMGQLDDWDLSDTQKTDFIRTFWELLLSFAQIGFEIHPAQQAQRLGRKHASLAPAKALQIDEIPALPNADLLYSEQIENPDIIETFTASATGQSADSRSKEAAHD